MGITSGFLLAEPSVLDSTGFICVFLMTPCCGWQSGGSCLPSEVAPSSGLGGLLRCHFLPVFCEGSLFVTEDLERASNLGGWRAVGVLALFLSSSSRKDVGPPVRNPGGKTVPVGVLGGRDIQALKACPRIQVSEKRECLSCKDPLLCFLVFVLPFKCREDAAQQDRLCSLGFWGRFVRCKCPM